jgi:Sulfatase
MHTSSSIICHALLTAAFLAPAWAPATCFDAAVGKPNVMVITVDDMNCDSVGAYGCRLEGITPVMDRLASQSLRFNQAFVQVGNCMPSRNVMFSGRYPHNNGVEGFYKVKNDYPVMADLMQGRDSPAIREAFMKAQEKESADRKAAKGKSAKGKSKKPAKEGKKKPRAKTDEPA